MALNFMIRSASSSVLPLAIRTIGSPKRFSSAVSAVLGYEKSNLNRSRSFIPFLKFCTTPTFNANLIPEMVDEIPEGFSFKVQGNPGERNLLLTTEYQDEIIKVEADMSGFHDGSNNDEETDNRPSLWLVLKLLKGNETCIRFGATVFPDEIRIDKLFTRSKNSKEPDEVPSDFHQLDENLKKAFYEYLEIRGVKHSTTNFLLSYAMKIKASERARIG